MSKEQAQRSENKRFILVVAAVLALFIGGSVTAFSVINSDINDAEQQIQQRLSNSFN